MNRPEAARSPFPDRGMSLIRVLILMLLLLCLPAAPVCGQERPVEIRRPAPDEIQELTLQDGSVVFGRVADTGDPMTFQLISGVEMRIPVSEVRSLRTARGEEVDGEFWTEDPNRTRLFFGPTARGLPAGEGYLAVYEIVMPFLGIAVTDRFILAGGTPLFFGGGGSRPFWIAPKFTFLDTGNTQVAAGVLSFVVEDESAGLIYGVLTRGGTRKSLSAGIGYGYVNDNLADTPALMIGGETRLSRRVKLLTENYWLPSGDGGLISFGPRFFGDRLSADLGLVMPVGGDEFFAFPLINFVWNF